MGRKPRGEVIKPSKRNLHAYFGPPRLAEGASGRGEMRALVHAGKSEAVTVSTRRQLFAGAEPVHARRASLVLRVSVPFQRTVAVHDAPQVEITIAGIFLPDRG